MYNPPKLITVPYWGRINPKGTASAKLKSITANNKYFTTLSKERKDSFLRGTNDIANYLTDLKKLGNLNNFTDEEIESFRNKQFENEPDYNDDLSQRVWGFLTNLKGDKFKKDNYSNLGKAKLGANITESVGKFHYDDYRSDYTDNELNSIKEKLGKKFNIEQIFKDGAYSNDIDPETGYKYWTLSTKYSPNGNGYYKTDNNVAFVTDKNGNFVKVTGDFGNEDWDGGYYKNIRVANDKDKFASDYIERLAKRIDKNKYQPLSYRGSTKYYRYHDDNGIWTDYNNEKDEKGNPIQMNINSCGGRTSRRLYAVGGAMGDIPLGPQEDYNMIGAGGSHEENPQGGVPYGMNQDGSQNMVEEGEVTVGNNVFSDRTAISPELCQQLGLPEGTSPAQAMQQIEQLYEQGQLSDEEYNEIQNIIFQDQEAQKQGGEQEMPQQPPVEGITPDMVQGGQGMPPEMMQQQAPMPQQGQVEGIPLDQLQGYAYGGRMW